MVIRFGLPVIFLVLSFVVTVNPTPASANAVSSFINCNGVDCSACNVVYTANKVITWLVGVLFMVFAILMVKAGFGLVTSGGNSSAMTDAKDSFTSAIIGLIIILASWVIVDTVIRGLGVTDGRGNPFPWSEVQCQVQVDVHAPTPNATPVISGRQVNIATPGQPTPQAGCANCERMSFVSCSNPSSCTVDATYAARLRSTLLASGESMQVTEGFPPTRQHQNACHSNGTCVDIVFADRNWSQARVDAFQASAQANGCRAVYEPNSNGSCPAGTYVQGRANNTCMPHSVTRSTGNHFSLYCN